METFFKIVLLLFGTLFLLWIVRNLAGILAALTLLGEEYVMRIVEKLRRKEKDAVPDGQEESEEAK